VKLDALDHPKTLDFAARLNVSRPTAIGHLELFWHFAAKHAPRGNIGKFPDGAIARACDWTGDPEILVKSLLKSGLMDESAEHRFLVHDWPEHCPNWVRAQLQKLKQSFYVLEKGTEEGTEEPSSEPSTRARVPREGKGSQGKGSQAIPREGKGSQESPAQSGSENPSSAGEESPGDLKNGAPPEEPSRRRGAGADRKNGDFEDINVAVSKVLATGGVKAGQYHEIARMAGITPLQAEISVRQLRDRGQVPKGAA
jgi:hypothetical protein